jgi:hypothetical protein
LVPEELVEAVGLVWLDVQPLFGPLTDATPSLEPAVLEAAGLSGVELNLKVGSALWSIHSDRV